MTGQVQCGRLDIAFVMDSSGSIGFDSPLNWPRMKLFLNSTLDLLYSRVSQESDIHVAVIIYNNNATLAFNLNQGTSKSEAQSRINALVYQAGATNIAAGLELARTAVFGQAAINRQDAADVVVLITDGVATLRIDETVNQATLLKNNNVFITTVGITQQVYQS